VLAKLEDLLISIGDPLRLIRTYQNIIAKEPDNQEIRFFLGKLYYRLEMVDDAFRELGALEDSFPEVHMLLGELYLKRQQCEKAAGEFKKTLHLSKALKVPYLCSQCGHAETAWAGRCPSCGRWNTFELRLDAVRQR
jgi:lipopolysaccharide biosynthesis regulator YciM